MRKIVLIFLLMILKILLNAQVTITYIGNMGVLVSDKSQSVLIDGLHDYYYKDYQFPSKKLVQSLINGNYLNYPSISLNLITHFHKDHFDEKLTSAFLSFNKAAKMVCPEQAKREILKVNKEVAKNIYPISLDDYKKSEFSFIQLEIKAFKMNHVNLVRHESVQNIGFILDIGGKKILHIGDTDWHKEINMFEKLNLINEQIDIAIIPVWMAMSVKSKSLLNKYIKPKEIIISHISPNMSNSEIDKIKKQFPKAYFFREIEERIEFN